MGSLSVRDRLRAGGRGGGGASARGGGWGGGGGGGAGPLTQHACRPPSGRRRSGIDRRLPLGGVRLGGLRRPAALLARTAGGHRVSPARPGAPTGLPRAVRRSPRG